MLAALGPFAGNAWAQGAAPAEYPPGVVVDLGALDRLAPVAAETRLPPPGPGGLRAMLAHSRARLNARLNRTDGAAAAAPPQPKAVVYREAPDSGWMRPPPIAPPPVPAAAPWSLVPAPAEASAKADLAPAFEEAAADLADAGDATAADRSDPFLDRDYWKGYLLRPIDIVTAPARWDTQDWITAGLVAGLGVGLYVVEEDIRDWLQDHRSDTADRASSFLEPFGSIYLLPGLGAGYLAGYLMDNRKAEESALLGLQSLVLASAAVHGLKRLSGRARPGDGLGHDAFDGPQGFGSGGAQLSFPSGHTIAAFSVATVIASEYDNPIVQAAAYSLAAGVGWSRMYDDQHWATDVLVGAALGYGIGKVVSSFSPFRQDDTLSVSGSLSGEGGSLMLTARF